MSTATKEVPPTATATCLMTRKELQDQLAASQYGSLTAIFNNYFLAGSMPPRCVACHRLVAEHADSSPSEIATGAVVVNMASATSLTASAAVSLPIQRPDLSTDIITMRAPRTFVFLVWFMMIVSFLMLAIGIAITTLPQAPHNGRRGDDGPNGTLFGFMAGFYVFFALLLNKYAIHCEITVKKNSREISLTSQSLLGCFSCRSGQPFLSVRFEDVLGVTVSRPDPLLQIIYINLRLRASAATNQREIAVPLQCATLMEYQNYVSGWQRYVGTTVMGMTGSPESALAPIVAAPLSVAHLDDSDVARPPSTGMHSRSAVVWIVCGFIEVLAFLSTPLPEMRFAAIGVVLISALLVLYHANKMTNETVSILRDFHLVSVTSKKTWFGRCFSASTTKVPIDRIQEVSVQATTIQCIAHMTIGLSIRADGGAAVVNGATAPSPSFIPLQTVSGAEAQCTLLAWENFFRPHLTPAVVGTVQGNLV